jgi:hypothetical protein
MAINNKRASAAHFCCSLLLLTFVYITHKKNTPENPKANKSQGASQEAVKNTSYPHLELAWS